MHGASPAEVPIPITVIGGLVTLASPDSLPVGASPRNYDWDYLVGSGQTRPGLTSVYAQVDSEVGPRSPGAAASATWVSPNNILAGDGSYTTFAPASAANYIDVTDFSFNLPSTDNPTGVLLSVTGYSNIPANLTAQLLIAGVPTGNVKTAALPQAPGIVPFGASDDQWGTIITQAQANSLSFGVRLSLESSGLAGATGFLDYVSMTLGVSTGTANFQYIGSFTNQDGTVRNISVDAEGNLWIENVSTAPGILSLSRTGLAQNALVSGCEQTGVFYIALGDGFGGIDMPLQYTPSWIDRITQVGPGAAPSFTPQQSSSDTYTITSITQPAQMSDPSDPGHFQGMLWSEGPTSTAPGNVVTIFYKILTPSGPNVPDMDLVNAFNSGYPVYVYMSGLSAPFVDGTYQVTSVGQAVPPGAEYGRYYFTYTVASSQYVYIGGPDTGTGYYNRTLATLTTATPVPNLAPGGQVVITGMTPSAWNATWTVTQTPNVSEMAINSDSISTAGVATITYALTGASPAPSAGQYVTITNTLNYNGVLNGTFVIQSVNAGANTFTINVSYVGDGQTHPDTNGLATTAGTIFTFDPGAGTVGTSTNPIYGAPTVYGLLVYNSSGLFIDPGTYQGTVGFITRNGLWTSPAPPVVFSVPTNTTSLQVTNIPVGPPNVVGRYISLTEAGQNGVPGGNFFVIPVPVDFYSQDVKYTANATVINDNSTTSVNLFFTGAVLLAAEAIDVYGYNLFNCIEIGDPAWTIGYAGRQWYGECVNKVQNFVNLSFDGGYNPGSQPAPLGWSQPDDYGYLTASPKFGNSYYIKNTSTGTLTTAGLISQSAYQDAYQEPIIEPNTTYSVRVTCSNPSGVNDGSLVVALVSGGVTLGSYTLPLSSMTTDLKIYKGKLLTAGLTVIPRGATLQVYASNLGVGSDVLVDRFDVYPTEIPVLTTAVYGSYAGLPEQVDSVTGVVGFSSENQQAVNGAMVLYDTFYGLKGWSGKTPGSSLYSLQKASNLEPAQWNEPEVAQRSGGAIGPMAFDVGEQWFLGASRNGLYLFVGGQPGKINQEIYQVWDAINWAAAQTIWVKVDLDARRIYVGVPMSTPNFWLPNAATVTNPTSPNVVLMCDFKGLDSGEELRQYPQMHTTMFGTLNAIDMRRKWSIWQIPAPYANLVQGPSDVEFYICNGRGTSKVYRLDPTAATDDGIVIDSLYTTAGIPGLSKRTEMPQFGKNRVRICYVVATLESSGNIQATLYANRLPGPTTPPVASWKVPGGFTPGNPYNDDSEAALNFAATRTFLELRQNDGKGGFSFSNLVMYGRSDPWNQMRGRTGA